MEDSKNFDGQERRSVVGCVVCVSPYLKHSEKAKLQGKTKHYLSGASRVLCIYYKPMNVYER